MLVLMRKVGESIMIGDDVEVTVVSADENKVKLSINAPREVPVYRREIYDAIKEENIQAARSAISLEKDIKELLGGEMPRPYSGEEDGDEEQ